MVLILFVIIVMAFLYSLLQKVGIVPFWCGVCEVHVADEYNPIDPSAGKCYGCICSETGWAGLGHEGSSENGRAYHVL